MTTVLPASTSAATTQTATAAQTTLSSDYETFLKMLTVQAVNQDPLDPMDSSEYAAQLASFSSVEQQVITNQLLSALASQMNTTSLAQYSGWVGMEARSTAGVVFEGAPQTLYPLPAVLADEAYLVVYDGSGNEMQRMSIGLDGEGVEWAGVGDDGTPIANGTYYFEVENHANGAELGQTPVETYQIITEAQVIDGQIAVILEGGIPLLPSNITALRDAV